MCYVNGLQTGDVMDSQAIEIFWNYIDSYWYSDLSTDDMFVKVFTKEADTIMKVSTTYKDIVKICIIAFTVIFVAIILIISIILIIKRKREKAAEDQRILETPINDSILKDTDSTNSKYL